MPFIPKTNYIRRDDGTIFRAVPLDKVAVLQRIVQKNIYLDRQIIRDRWKNSPVKESIAIVAKLKEGLR